MKHYLKSNYRFWAIVYLSIGIMGYLINGLDGRALFFNLELRCWQIIAIDIVVSFIFFPVLSLVVDYVIGIIKKKPLNMETYGVFAGLIAIVYLSARLSTFWMTGSIIIGAIGIWVSFLCGMAIYYISKFFVFLKLRLLA